MCTKTGIRGPSRHASLSPRLPCVRGRKPDRPRHRRFAAAARHQDGNAAGIRRTGGVWSPESLLCAAVADCFILTFRGLSRAARLDWLKLECRTEGTLERVEDVSQFTRYATFATLTVPAGSDVTKARTMLERAEHSCLISNSLRGVRTLEAEVDTAPPA